MTHVVAASPQGHSSWEALLTSQIPAARLMCSTWPVLGHAQGTQRHKVLVLTPGRDSGLEGIQDDHPSGFPGAERVPGLRTSVPKLKKSWTNAQKTPEAACLEEWRMACPRLSFGTSKTHLQAGTVLRMCYRLWTYSQYMLLLLPQVREPRSGCGRGSSQCRP